MNSILSPAPAASKPNRPHYDKDAVKSAARGRWGDIIPAVANVGREFFAGSQSHGPCPKCGGKDRWRFTDSEGTGGGGGICNQCGKFGDGLAVLGWLNGWTFPETLARVAEQLGVAPGSMPTAPASSANGRPVSSAASQERGAANHPPASPSTLAGSAEVPPEILDKINRRLLENLELFPDHREELLSRGFRPDQIEENGYRSIDPATLSLAQYAVVERLKEFGQAEMVKVIPGIDSRIIRFVGRELLLPARNLAGQIIALRRRRIGEAAEKWGKYAWLTSFVAGKEGQPPKVDGPKARPAVHVPLGIVGPSEVVRITEGELKADRAYLFDGIATISLPGVGSWRDALPIVCELVGKNPPGQQRVRFAFDADANTNPAVAGALRDAVEFFARESYAVEIERWPIEAGKGLDDVFQAGRDHQIELLTGPAALEYAGNVAALAGVKAKNQSTADESTLPQIVRVDHFAAGTFELRPRVVNNLLRVGEVANIIAAPKVGKSFLALDLAYSVTTGARFLQTDEFACTPGPVLLIDNELHEPTLKNRIQRVGKTGRFILEGAHPLEYSLLRGSMLDIEKLGKLFETVEPGRYRLVILDALYRLLPDGTDENDNAGITRVYNLIDQYAAKMGCAFALIHHTSKGAQGSKAITDVGAGAGAQSRAADTHIVLRHHQEPGAIVLDATCRSFAGSISRCYRWEFPLWIPAPELDASALKIERPSRPTATPPTSAELDKRAAKVRDILSKHGPQAKSAIRDRAGINGSTLTQVLDFLIERGEIEEGTGSRKGSTVFSLTGKNSGQIRTNPDSPELSGW